MEEHKAQLNIMLVDDHQVMLDGLRSIFEEQDEFDVIGEATIADAILDRLVHTSYRIELKGESLRKKM